MALLVLVRPASWLAAARRRPIELRNGLRLQTTRALDYLIIKEVVRDDVYGLRKIDETSPAVVVDVGAGIGDFALLTALLYPSASVLAFEPDRKAFRALEENIAHNGALNVEAHRLAIGTRSGAAKLEPFLGDREVDLLKIDCEGAELDVLVSAGAELARVRRVVLEYHRRVLPEADRRVSEYLRAWGFLVRSRADPYDDEIGYVDARAPGG